MSDNPFTVLRGWTVGHNVEDEAVLLRMVTVGGEAIDVLVPADASHQMTDALALAAAQISPRRRLDA